jgi:tetratricopeptide (TPR) repeat protein
LARVARDQGRYDEAERYLENALALGREIDDRDIAGALNLMVFCVCEPKGDADKAERFAGESLAIYKRIGDQGGTAQALRRLAEAAMLRREYEASRRYLEESLEICRESGNRPSSAAALANLSWNACLQGKYAEAVRYGEEARAIYRGLGGINVAGVLCTLGHAYAGLGEDDAAWGYLREALKESLIAGIVPVILETLVGVARLRAKAGQYRRAAELLGLALGHPALHVTVSRYAEPVLAMLRESLPAAELEAAMARGRSLDLDATVAELLDELEG